ncbi:hypothetical protein DERF_004426 [Dermatophagoides farinae]|uniref:Uncharacterized protein n=1 Tax=Dermatophagoides farinae TaxID=6954 RepID=A0A922L5I1_DERFA|nr:hypothetical protein DERF_004426 [Dermatophagoides farinae]
MSTTTTTTTIIHKGRILIDLEAVSILKSINKCLLATLSINRRRFVDFFAH